jgi:hypothetical protein
MKSIDTFINNALLSRAAFYNNLLDGKNEDRNIDNEAGYPESISIDDYVQMYRRQDIAQRVVTLEPEESWSEYPDVYETDEGRETAFEKAISSFVVETSLHEYLAKVDTVSGIGQYALLFIGLDDGQKFNTPAPGFTEDGPAETPGAAKVLYYRVFDQSSARISEYERDRKNPRYGQPKVYELDFQDTVDSTLDTNATPVTDTLKVHWSRVIHVADTRGTTSEIFGFPRMEPVFNRLFDVRKINVASGEAYWKGGFPGYAFEVDPQNGELSEEDRESIKDEIYKYENGMSRYFAGVGVQVKPLTPTLVSPQPFIDNALRMIAAAKGYPITKLVGNYGGNQTNAQDEDAWRKKIAQRRELFVTPKIIRATINRIQQLGALPPTKSVGGKSRPYIVKWKPLAEMTEAEKAEIGLKRTEALARYTTAGSEAIIPLIDWLTKIMGLRFEEAQAIAEAERTEFSPVLQELAKGLSGQQNNTPSSIPAVPKPIATKDPSKTPTNQVQKENPGNG